jgi:hypothetical protein
MENRDAFHPLANDGVVSNPSPANSPVQVMGSGKEANWKSTREGDCDSDNKPMQADSTAHRK